MHASCQIINQVLWLAYITHKQCIYKFLKLMQMQASAWICTYQMQTTKFMSLLPLLVCSSCPRILILLNIAPLDPCPWSHSHLPLCHPRIIHIFVHFSPFVINDHKKGQNHMKFVMWRLRATTWSCTSCTCRVTTWIPLVDNHMKHLWFDTKSWIWVDGWVLNLHFYGHFQFDWNWHHL